jgi:Zn-dependent protease
VFGDDFIRQAIIAAPVILFSLTVHEFFHAWSAHKFGDNTARDLGRMTLNPLAHLDFFGTLAFFISGFRFGWAKPVPVNLHNLRNPRTADLWISAAGPLSNLGMGLIFGLLIRIVTVYAMDIPEAAGALLWRAVEINVALAFFNLIPLFPLDGSHVLRNLLPPQYGEMFSRLDMIAPIILMIVMFTGFTWVIIGPIVIRVVMLFTGYGA